MTASPPARTAYLDPAAFTAPADDPIRIRRRRRRQQQPVWLIPAIALVVAGLLFLVVGLVVLANQPPDKPPANRLRGPGR